MKIKIAALIPAFNEELLIGKTIKSLREAGMQSEDIFVIDDGSTDNTASEAGRWGVNILHNPQNRNMGKAESVNHALRRHRLLYRYTHISFLDADTLVDPKYFKAVRIRLKADSEIGVLCGRPKSLPQNWLTAWRAYQYFIADAIYKPAQSRMQVVTVAPGCAATYSVKALEKITWKGDTPAEDMDATIQAILKNIKVSYESQAIVYTQDPRQLRSYIGQVGKRWNAGAWQIMRKYGLLWKGLFKPLHWECRLMFLEPFTYIGLIVYCLVNRRAFLPQTIALMFILTAVMAAIAAWKEKRRDIFIYCWTFPFMWLLDFSLFLWASRYLLIGPQAKKRIWYSVPRYTINGQPGR